MNLFKDFDGYIFDFDGTLVDSMEFWVNLYKDTAKKYNFTANRRYLEVINAMSITEGAVYITKTFNVNVDSKSLANMWVDKIYNNYKNDIKLKPYLKEVIDKLKQNGKKLAIATAADKDLCEVCLKQNNVLDYFDEIITVNDVGIGKSSPLVYNTTAKLINTDIKRSVVFEDSKIGLRTANKEGYFTIGIKDNSINDEEPYVCDLLIESFKELL